ncbi:non-heme iron oxygenase ferredoxin subunit [Oceanicella sp. SM1341]|uniref:non-heme iron oxygenase ferredoxin subunit n=1 Tax=Oceanicella sp. SM1341 TaxID=1548889 RepID=UPI000E4F2D19|nr:non-heme iron oxygenase ferredoxin subunit [Oceanicella sp. SM1341]
MTDDWTRLCATGDVPEGEARSFTAAGKRLCVINDGAQFYVLDDLCTHGQAWLSEGYCDTEDCVIECPLHGGLFDYRDGKPAGDPAEKDAPTYAVRVEGDAVLVALAGAPA